MSIPKDLAKKRDELAKKHSDASQYFNAPHAYKDGFDVGVQAAFESEHVAGLVEALEKCKVHSECYEELLMIINTALAKWEKRND